MNSSDKDYIEHEVRIRMLEQLSNTVYAEMKELRRDVDTSFKWTIGIIFAMYGGLLLSKFA